MDSEPRGPGKGRDPDALPDVPTPSPGERCPAIPSGAGIGQPGEQKMHVCAMDSIPHGTLASLPQPGEGNMPSGRHPAPTKRPLWELEVRMRGRWDSWVRVPAHCQSLGHWANISGIKRRAACPARPPELQAAGRSACLVSAKGCELLGGEGGRCPRNGRWELLGGEGVLARGWKVLGQLQEGFGLCSLRAPLKSHLSCSSRDSGMKYYVVRLQAFLIWELLPQ